MVIYPVDDSEAQQRAPTAEQTIHETISADDTAVVVAKYFKTRPNENKRVVSGSGRGWSKRERTNIPKLDVVSLDVENIVVVAEGKAKKKGAFFRCFCLHFFSYQLVGDRCAYPQATPANGREAFGAKKKCGVYNAGKYSRRGHDRPGLHYCQKLRGRTGNKIPHLLRNRSIVGHPWHRFGALPYGQG